MRVHYLTVVLFGQPLQLQHRVQHVLSVEVNAADDAFLQVLLSEDCIVLKDQNAHLFAFYKNCLMPSSMPRRLDHANAVDNLPFVIDELPFEIRNVKVRSTVAYLLERVRYPCMSQLFLLDDEGRFGKEEIVAAMVEVKVSVDYKIDVLGLYPYSFQLVIDALPLTLLRVLPGIEFLRVLDVEASVYQ